MVTSVIAFWHWTLCLPLAAQTAVPATPTPTPTPRPIGPMVYGGTQRLGDIAWQIKLDRSAIEDEDEDEDEDGEATIVLTNESIKQLGGQRMLTSGSGSSTTTAPVDPEQLSQRAAQREKVRKHWRKLYDAQLERVRKVEGELAIIDVKIASLADRTGGSGSKEVTARARLAEARQKRRTIAERLRREQDRLQSIISQARRQGAEPGWFRP
jgi:hypothetical protein